MEPEECATRASLFMTRADIALSRNPSRNHHVLLLSRPGVVLGALVHSPGTENKVTCGAPDAVSRQRDNPGCCFRLRGSSLSLVPTVLALGSHLSLFKVSLIAERRKSSVPPMWRIPA